MSAASSLDSNMMINPDEITRADVTQGDLCWVQESDRKHAVQHPAHLCLHKQTHSYIVNADDEVLIQWTQNSVYQYVPRHKIQLVDSNTRTRRKAAVQAAPVEPKKKKDKKTSSLSKKTTKHPKKTPSKSSAKMPTTSTPKKAKVKITPRSPPQRKINPQQQQKQTFSIDPAKASLLPPPPPFATPKKTRIKSSTTTTPTSQAAAQEETPQPPAPALQQQQQQQQEQEASLSGRIVSWASAFWNGLFGTPTRR